MYYKDEKKLHYQKKFKWNIPLFIFLP